MRRKFFDFLTINFICYAIINIFIYWLLTIFVFKLRNIRSKKPCEISHYVFQNKKLQISILQFVYESFLKKYVDKAITYNKLNRYYYWSKIINTIFKYVKKCYYCKNTKHCYELNFIIDWISESESICFRNLTLHHVNILVEQSVSNLVIFIITNQYQSLCIAYCFNNIIAASIRCLYQCFSRFFLMSCIFFRKSLKLSLLANQHRIFISVFDFLIR